LRLSGDVEKFKTPKGRAKKRTPFTSVEQGKTTWKKKIEGKGGKSREGNGKKKSSTSPY